MKKERQSREHLHRPVCYQPQDPIPVLTTEKSYFTSLPYQKKIWAAWRHFLGAKKNQIQARERDPGKSGFIPSLSSPHGGQKAQEGVPALQSVLHGSESFHKSLLPLLLSEKMTFEESWREGRCGKSEGFLGPGQASQWKSSSCVLYQIIRR